MSSVPAFEEEGFEEEGFEYFIASTPPAAPTSSGQAGVIRAFRRTPFKIQIILTAAIHKPFAEELALDGALIHRFEETLIIKVSAVKPFEEQIRVIGGLDIMEWIISQARQIEELIE